MNWQLLPSASQEGKLGNHFLRELVRAIDVIASGDDNRQLIGGIVSFGHHLCSSFGS